MIAASLWIDSGIRLVGGRPALDFVNTLHDWYRQPAKDYLPDGPHYLGWSERAGLLDRREVSRIVASGGVPLVTLTDVRRLREQLHEVFVSWIEERRPEPAAVAGLDAWIQRAWRARTLTVKSGNVRLAWKEDAIDASLPLRRVALDALDILETLPRDRLKQCAAESKCGWLFFDESKNNSRRWCSMDTCGAEAKMRRYRSQP
jgi:predicted RNA-binding Zn ribbon-like protein